MKAFNPYWLDDHRTYWDQQIANLGEGAAQAAHQLAHGADQLRAHGTDWSRWLADRFDDLGTYIAAVCHEVAQDQQDHENNVLAMLEQQFTGDDAA